MAFLQLHRLSVAPASAANRDDSGRHKTLHFGGAPRLRISSQSIKRSIRFSDRFTALMPDGRAMRSRHFAAHALAELTKEGYLEAEASEALHAITGAIGKLTGEAAAGQPPRTAEPVLLSAQELHRLLDLAREVLHGGDLPDEPSCRDRIFGARDRAVDIALFGRLLPREPALSTEAAVQVAHAFTTHRAVPEVDFFAAVDDLAQMQGRREAAFIGRASYGSGVFYSYACLDHSLLLRNLDGDLALAEAATGAFIQTFAETWPQGRKAGFAHHAPALYMMAEYGRQQPRSLAGAFHEPVEEQVALKDSIAALETMATQFARLYGPGADVIAQMSIHDEQTSLGQLIARMTDALPDA